MYQLSDFTASPRGDLFGGVTAAIVALPLALAFGIASGAGPMAGLYGAIFVGFFAAVFGGTRTQISGPTGPMTVVMTAVIVQFSADYPEAGLQLAFATVIVAGLIQIAMGMLKLGRYITMVPYPVISGFMSGIGVIIILLEIGPLLGYPASGGVLESVSMIPTELAHPVLTAVWLALLTLALVFFWPARLNRIIPAPLVALIVGTLALLLIAPDSPIEHIGEIPSGLPVPAMPPLEWSALGAILKNGVVLAMLGAIDSLLTSLVADNMSRTQHDSDKELLGQGIGNTLAGFFGGLPGAGATMRTVVNIRAGGEGPLSGVVHALVLLAIATSIGFLFEDIPQVVLAAILVKVGVDIIDWPFLKRLHRVPRGPAALMLLVFVLTVFVDLITAVLVGVFIANVITIEELTNRKLKDVVLSDGKAGTERLSEAERAYLNDPDANKVLLRVDFQLTYAVARGLRARVAGFGKIDQFLIDLRGAGMLDVTTVSFLEELTQDIQDSGGKVMLACDDQQVLSSLENWGLLAMLGQENIRPVADDYYALA
ncbi:MAG: SulP family inorganic anion transporter [Gammaproteobacteria bacterium]